MRISLDHAAPKHRMIKHCSNFFDSYNIGVERYS